MTTAQSDVVTLAVVVVGLLLTVALLALARRLTPAAPLLPEADRAPAGLGRLVPVGGQVDVEVRRGLAALEAWVAAQRRATP